jgi:hypothetical protein
MMGIDRKTVAHTGPPTTDPLSPSSGSTTVRPVAFTHRQTPTGSEMRPATARLSSSVPVVAPDAVRRLPDNWSPRGRRATPWGPLFGDASELALRRWRLGLQVALPGRAGKSDHVR